MPDEQVTKRRFGFEFIETPDDVNFRMTRTARMVLIGIAALTVTALLAVLLYLATTGNLDILTRQS
jgi:hypothetical protein